MNPGVLPSEAEPSGEPDDRHAATDGAEVGPPLPLGGPATAAWREDALTKAWELGSLADWIVAERAARRTDGPDENSPLVKAIREHLEAARSTAAGGDPGRKVWEWFRSFGGGSKFERTMGNLDAAEADLLRLAPEEYVRGMIPSLLAHVNRHLAKDDPRRRRFDSVASALEKPEGKPLMKADRGVVVAAYHAANSQRRRDMLRVRSFRNVLFGAALLLALVAVGLGILGSVRPHMIPLCFHPDAGSADAKIVCPTNQVNTPPATGEALSEEDSPDADDYIALAVSGWDVWLVEVLGLVAAALGSAFALRNLRGTSTPYKIPIALAVLKLPTGAVTAVLGLLLMRGGFVPGLSALDTPAQILSWAIVFGYSQQLFTRFVDLQGQAVLEGVRGRGAAGQREVEPRADV